MEIINGEITMKVKEFIKLEIDIDVVDDVCEELYIAFCGAMELTEAGEKHFAEALEYDITLHNSGMGELGIVHVDDPSEEVWEHRLEKAKELFESMAGYCYYKDYDKWFKVV